MMLTTHAVGGKKYQKYNLVFSSYLHIKAYTNYTYIYTFHTHTHEIKKKVPICLSCTLLTTQTIFKKITYMKEVKNVFVLPLIL